MSTPEAAKSKPRWGWAAAVVGVFLALAWGAVSPLRPAQAEPLIYASPVHAGCYWAVRDICKIHVEPFTLNLTTGTKLVQFQLVATRLRTGAAGVIYDFRPDTANSLPGSGTTYTPSLVKKDFAARCGETYSVTLQGQNTGDPAQYILGSTSQFTCPAGQHLIRVPQVRR